MVALPMRPVAILGAGLIGASWARLFLAQGFHVQLWDPDPCSRHHLEKILPPGPWVMCADAAGAVTGSGFVQESGPEDLELKRALYADIGHALAEDAIVASSSSTLKPSDLQHGLGFASRVLVGHPFNPPEIIRLVEIVPGAETSAQAVAHAEALYRRLGKHPIVLRRERAGHLANRLQAAVWREAVDAVATGQASVDDVDAAMVHALGPRWAVMGPFATFHLGGGEGGLASFLRHLGPAFERLWDDAKRPSMDAALQAQIVAETEMMVGGASAQELAAERDVKLRRVLATAARAANRGSSPGRRKNARVSRS